MKRLTIRGFDDELRARLQDLARERGISLNRAALLLPRRGAGLDRERRAGNVVGDALDELAGSLTREEERELLESLDIFERSDESPWQ